MNQFELPTPNANEIARSKALATIIGQQILQAGGQISFATYMQLALYYPNLGYYMADTPKLGKAGDFITAPLISPLFAACLARQCQEVLAALGHKAAIFELGAGDGSLARDLLRQLALAQALPVQYFIYEISPYLRQQQQLFLAQQLSQEVFARITWLEQLPTVFNGIIIANEVLDALPVHCFSIREGKIFERAVKYRDQQFYFIEVPPQPHLKQAILTIQQTYELDYDYASEINLDLSQFLAPLTQMLKTGLMLFIDYGYGEGEYYHPERAQGTLNCFYRHLSHSDPFWYPGLQDISCHVNFTQLIEQAHSLGCQLAGYTTQAAFLLACGLLGIAAGEEKQLNETAALKQHQAIKTLTLPTEMGERVKVMALSKNFSPTSLLGFNLQDRRRDL